MKLFKITVILTIYGSIKFSTITKIINKIYKKLLRLNIFYKFKNIVCYIYT